MALSGRHSHERIYLLLKVPNHEMLLCRIDTPALLAEKHFTVLSVQLTNVSISLGKSAHAEFWYDGIEFNYNYALALDYYIEKS